jgi:hypothetical protein
MSSSFSCLTIKQYLAKEQKFFVVACTASCYLFGLILLLSGSQELYKSKRFVVHHCQVKSTDLKYINRSLFPRWNITVMDDNKIEEKV